MKREVFRISSEAETQMLDVMSNELKYMFLETIASDNFHYVLRSGP